MRVNNCRSKFENSTFPSLARSRILQNVSRILLLIVNIPLSTTSKYIKFIIYWGPVALRRRSLKTEISLWKRIRCLLSTLRSYHRSFWICAREKLSQRNVMIIMTLSFSKSSVFKTFLFHTKTKKKKRRGRFFNRRKIAAFLRRSVYRIHV